jgi:uncharacterized protein (TIGR00725 family)
VSEPVYISVIGTGEASAEQYEQARELGRLAAERGGLVLCGGRGGVMEAAARGASEAGGVAIGILPDEDRHEANPYLTYSLVSGIGQARNLAVACSGEVVIAVGGGYGTLSEIGLARRFGRPVVALHSWELPGHVIAAGSPDEAVEAAFELLGS